MFLIAMLMLMSFSAASLAGEPERKPFGAMRDGTPIEQFTLRNKNGMTAKFINYGAIITELHVPDKSGHTADVVLGFDNLNDYLALHPYFGCIIGRVANRIAKGKFKLDGKTHTLTINNYPNHLHGGESGFDKKVWKTDALSENTIRFQYRSPDGEENYPGQLDIAVTYTITEANEWRIDYEASTDKSTPINLTQHAYFNLGGHNSGDILGHELGLWGAKYTPTDYTMIPTGEIRDVKGTAFDFTQPKLIGRDLSRTGGNPLGFDLNYVVTGEVLPERDQLKGLRLAARLKDPKSGRIMEVQTTEPGLQLYTGNVLDGSIKGKGGAIYKQYAGVCLEAQHFPDAVNTPNFKSIILKPGETYRQTTIYKFSAE